MKLYLVRHGEYLPLGECPLNEKGCNDIKILADTLKRLSVRATHLFHSELLRAKQTAELLSEGIVLDNPPSLKLGIKPDDSVEVISYEINNFFLSDTVLVSHLPFLGKLAGKLLLNDENRNPVDFYPGTIACLEKTAAEPWKLNWILHPEM